MNDEQSKIIVMGVAGCGKTTVGQALASKLQLPFLEGDDYHPPSNRTKLEAGEPLNDDDRAPWLNALVAAMNHQPLGFVLSCSALKHKYREVLRESGSVRFVYLTIDLPLAKKRVEQRAHFFDPDLIQSQFETLEVPSGADVITVPASLPLPLIIEEVLRV